jgi:hypothetical protein
MDALLPGTEVVARDLRWEVVLLQNLGGQTLYRLRGLEGALRGYELDVLYPFEKIVPIRHALEPRNAAPITNWRVYHEAFLLEQALGRNAFLATHPGRLQLSDLNRRCRVPRGPESETGCINSHPTSARQPAVDG